METWDSARPRTRTAPFVCSTESFCPALSGRDFWKLRVTSSRPLSAAAGKARTARMAASAARDARREKRRQDFIMI